MLRGNFSQSLWNCFGRNQRGHLVADALELCFGLGKHVLRTFRMGQHDQIILTFAQPADFGVCDYNAIVADPMVLETLRKDPSVLDRIDALLPVLPIALLLLGPVAQSIG